jgi:hypothetical protein
MLRSTIRSVARPMTPMRATAQPAVRQSSHAVVPMGMMEREQITTNPTMYSIDHFGPLCL